MGTSCWDYDGYGRSWLCKTDITPKNLKRYGIHATVKQIRLYRDVAIVGHVLTGGRGYTKRVNKYSIDLLKKEFNK